MEFRGNLSFGKNEYRQHKSLRLLFVVNVDWFFLSHRLPLAQAARDAGLEVFVVAADTREL